MGQNMVQVLDGDTAWASASGRLVPVSRDQIEAMRQGTYANPVRLLTTLSDPKAEIRYAGTDTAFGKTADVIEWNRPGGKPARVFIDSATGLLVIVAPVPPTIDLPVSCRASKRLAPWSWFVVSL